MKPFALKKQTENENDEESDKHESSKSDHDDAPHEEHPPGGGAAEEPWLVSYADLMTLLFGFFAMLFTFATFEEQKEGEVFVKVRKEVATYFGATHINPANELLSAANSRMGEVTLPTGVDIKEVSDGIAVSLITNTLFTSGEATLLPESVKTLQVLINLIKDTNKKINAEMQVRVEGHADDTPVSGVRWPSNWELSAARAGTIVRLFEKEGYPVRLLEATGYGSSRPAFPNRDDSGKPIPINQGRNRRVVVKVLTPRDAPAAPVEEKPALIEKH